MSPYVRLLFADSDWRKTLTDLGFQPGSGGVEAASEWVSEQPPAHDWLAFERVGP